jgi:hypothetical protein
MKTALYLGKGNWHFCVGYFRNMPNRVIHAEILSKDDDDIFIVFGLFVWKFGIELSWIA